MTKETVKLEESESIYPTDFENLIIFELLDGETEISRNELFVNRRNQFLDTSTIIFHPLNNKLNLNSKTRRLYIKKRVHIKSRAYDCALLLLSGRLPIIDIVNLKIESG